MSSIPSLSSIEAATKSKAWVHVDGAFGLWARASSRRALTEGIEGADSWTTDGPKWLNTPYDGAVAIWSRRRGTGPGDEFRRRLRNSLGGGRKKNLTLESRGAPRGILYGSCRGRPAARGSAQLVGRHCNGAAWLADRRGESWFDVLNRVVLNQLVVRCGSGEQIMRNCRQSASRHRRRPVWDDRAAGPPSVLRISPSSWRTEHQDVAHLAEALAAARN